MSHEYPGRGDDDPAFSSTEDIRSLIKALSEDTEEHQDIPDPFDYEEEEDKDIEAALAQTKNILTLFRIEDIDNFEPEELQKLLFECDGDIQNVVDLCLAVSDEVSQGLGKHWPITVGYLLERSESLTDQERFEQTSHDVDQLSGIFGWKSRNRLYRWANMRPRNSRAVRRLAWVVRQPVMEGFSDEVQREIARRRELGEPERFGLQDCIGLAKVLVDFKLDSQRRRNTLNEATSYNRETEMRDLMNLERTQFVSQVI